VTNHVRVELPFHLRNLARVPGEITVEVSGAVTVGSVLDAVEHRYPVLRGTIRDHGTHKRRAFLRFFACQEDLSLEASDFVLPERVASGAEPFMVVGALAGG
jgi:molybdopterin synthase sulfur carrier subunit